MHYQPIHPFDLTPNEMQPIQRKLRQQITIQPYTSTVQYVAGVDIAYHNDWGVAVIVVLDYATHEMVETVWHQAQVTHDYTPGYLAFRELPLFLAAWEKLATDPQLVFFDGNGMLHPQRVGLATHASFFIDKPTIGIAKTHFIGTYETPAREQGSFTLIHDQDEVIGAVLRTQTGVKPVYISIGNLLTLQNAIDFSLHFVGTKSRIPEITRQADLLTRQLRRELS